ncbi:MAG: Ger(x)C family spore germination C-terminal domain-containing protein [Porcipelethomonas sp.]
MKVKRLIYPLLLLPVLSGCSQSSDVRSKAFIKEMGADWSDGLHVSLRTFGSDDVISGSGATLLSAVGDCENSQEKNLFAGHLEVFAASPENISDDLMTLLSNNRISPSCYVICIPENASEFIENSGGDLAGMIESNGRNGVIVPKNISSVVNDLLEDDRKAAVPTIKDGNPVMMVISSDKAVGVLTQEESKGLCWLCGTVSDIYLPVKYSGRETDFYIRKSSTRIIADEAGDSINITIEIKINGNAENDRENLEEIKKEAGKTISALCSRTIAKTVTGMKADLFGIEKNISAAGISCSGSWEEIIPKLDFSYKIKIAE